MTSESEKLGELIGGKLRDAKGARETQGLKADVISSFFVFADYKLKVRTSRVLIEERSIGSYFILGSATNGVLGTDALGTNMIWGNASSLWGTALWGGTLTSYSTIESLTPSQELTDVGKNEIAKWLNNESPTAPTHIGVGTDSTAFSVSDTALGTEVTRDSIDTFTTTTNAQNTYIMEVLSTQTAFHGSALREIGLFDAAATGDMYSRYIISSLTMDNTKDYKFTIDYDYTDDSIGQATVTTAGMNEVRDFMGGVAATVPTHTAWGTGTTSVSEGDTTLEGEQQRNIFSTQSRVNNLINYEAILTAAQATGQSITKSGIFNDPTTGVLFAETKYGAIAKSALFQIQETDQFRVI